MRFSSLENILFSTFFLSSGVIAHETNNKQDTETINIRGYQVNSIGQSLSASQGYVNHKEIGTRPLLRTGEILEFVPGMVVTQHSGSGKANQYFLRGFNLDHGTDFSTSIDGMPVNMRTHGHGQGYTDLNFIIPELIASIQYRKGSYYADVGDFSSAGAAHFNLMNVNQSPQASLTLGEFQYKRLFAAASTQLNQYQLLLGGEKQYYSGPWDDVDENINKTNLIMRLSSNQANESFSITAMLYQNTWQSADQIPTRAINQGLITEYGSLDTNLGGKSKRYSLSANWQKNDWDASAYLIDSELELFSNFTYFLDNPEQGDQFQQVDKRQILGGELKSSDYLSWFNKPIKIISGLQTRFDRINQVGLYQTENKIAYNTLKQDKVDEYSIGLWSQLGVELNEALRLTLGARYDYFALKVESQQAADSGKENDGLVSLKANLSYQWNDNLELYLSSGEGYHSNDARGATLKQDAVDILVSSFGAETGFRWHNNENLNISAAIWMLDLDSELLFVGDAGNTEPSRPSTRSGVEFSGYYWFEHHWNIDLELAWTKARYSDTVLEEGKYIDGALPFVASAGINYVTKHGWQAALRYRYFAPRALDSYNQINGSSTQNINFSLGYQWHKAGLALEVMNLLDSGDHDIEYYYESQLKAESSPVEDIHYHPLEPRSIRVKVNYQF
ncbi:TonB-dependent receptor [Catenovulum maritimum]|uniref:TonB-dependent receptor n=1 Tax=Catenovulum maritimum TaxID=1513271 RepID=A0A0J8GLX6_9ALTE|nr:TonB-dependent receptor [Catenovulum maritimum]KMT63827.1 TonB-dependent receptor [Catenovulum maritimum]